MKFTHNDIQLSDISKKNISHYQRADAGFRCALTQEVMSNIEVPQDWLMEGEYPTEEDDYFPVVCRLLPKNLQFHLSLCCPSDIYSGWLLIMIANQGDTVIVIDQFPLWVTDAINQSVRNVVELARMWDDVDDIIVALISQQTVNKEECYQ